MSSRAGYCGRWGAALAAILAAGQAAAEDWPTYQHDERRSGVTRERLDMPLRQRWVYRSRHAPQPAWPAPAKTDYWHSLPELSPRVTYDRAFHVAAVGDAVYLGSSADDKVYCLDAATGRLRWAFFTGGPVRLAPTVHGGRVYAGSDDGCVYCLAAADGRLLWTYRADAEGRCVIGNGRLIAACPVRTGLVANSETVWLCAGLFPNEGVYLAAIDARTGKEKWKHRLDAESPQGYLLASPSVLYVPTGRTAPVAFRRAEGTRLGRMKGTGGAYALLASDMLAFGPGRTGQMDAIDPATRDHLVTFDGLHMVVAADRAYLQTSTTLSAFDRPRYLRLIKERKALSGRQAAIAKRLKQLGKRAVSPEGKRLAGELATMRARLAAIGKELPTCFLWRQPCAQRYALILAGDTLFAGGDGAVTAYAAAGGKRLWSAPVAGRAYGLAVANGRLLASTDRGTIHCFGN